MIMTIPEPLLLYDGDCGVCGTAVRFVLRHDRHRAFHLAPLDSEVGRRVTATFAGAVPDSLIMYDRGRALARSAAVFAILRRLGGAWHLLRIGELLPRPLADAAYDLIARHRRGISARLGLACHLPMEAGRGEARSEKREGVVSDRR